MRNPLRFFVELLQQPIWLPVWVFYLVVVNMASVGFWHEPLAKIIFFTFMASALLIMALYSQFGFEKVMGLGHVFWIPLLVYVLMQLPAFASPFKSYLAVLSVSIAISLTFDSIDVWKYFANRRADGERG